MRSARQPSHSPRRPDHQPRSVRGAVVDTVVGTAIAMAVLSGLSGCAQVDLDELIGSRPTSASPSPASHASTAPPQMVLPTPLPTGQATAASTVTAGFPELAGYTSASPTAAFGATTSTTTRSPATSWSRSYVSRSSTYQVSAEVTSSPELVATGATTMRCPSTGPSPWPASTRTTGRPRGWSSRRPTGPSPMPVSLRPSVPASPVLRSSGGPSRGYGPPTAPHCP